MKVYRILEKLLLKCINYIWNIFIMIHEIKNVLKKYKLYKNIKLTKFQKKQIDEFYKKHYGKKIRYLWHRLYQSYTGNFDYRYIPEYIFSTKIEPRNNKRIDVLPFENKNMLSVIFKDENVKIPKTFIMCTNGRFLDGNRDIITKKQAIDILKNNNKGTFDCVIKNTVDTNSGIGVKIASFEKGIDKISNLSIDQLINKMNNDFVVQEKIIPHRSFAKLYDKSINTLRVITYILDSKIYVAPIIMRIGQGGGMIDNAHAGGMFIGVDENGKLLGEAFTEFQMKYKKHPDTNVKFYGYQLPKICEIREIAINLHKRLPMLDYISWDFTVDQNENIVLIESNLHSQAVWVSQIAHGKGFFGENTYKILSNIKNKNSI